MKRIWSLMQQDFLLSLRDNIMLYIIIGPILLAFATKMFIPAVEDVRFAFAVERSVDQQYIGKLLEYGEVELFDTTREVVDRVERTDAIPGVLMEEGQIKILFEGNEPRDTIETYQLILEQAFTGWDRVTLTAKSLGAESTFLYDLLTVLIMMTAFFLGGVVPGFSIVNEKDGKAIRSIAVSPMRFYQFLAARGLVATLISTLIILASSFIMVGGTIAYGQLLVLLLCSVATTTLVCLIMGRLANNQIGALAAIKLIMPVYLTLPLVSIFLPAKWQVFFYPLPNYWQFRALQSIFANSVSGVDFWLAAVLTLTTGTIVLIALAKVFQRHFGIR